MKRNELVLLLAGLSLAGTTGCMEVSEKVQSGTRYVITGHPGGAYQPRNVNKYDLENSAKFVLLDKGVERSVTCPNIEERISDDGRMEVIANVRNRLNRRSEEHTSELQSQSNLVCRLLLEKKKQDRFYVDFAD